MSGSNAYLQDIMLLGRGLIPPDISEILVDRQLSSENVVIKNMHYSYLKNGKFSDLIKSDLNYVYRNKSPQLRPIISSYGGGKSTLLIQIENIARKEYGSRAIVIKINMSSYTGIDEANLKKYVFRQIFIELKPYLSEILNDLGKNFYLSYINPCILRDLASIDERVREEAFQKLIGEIQTDSHDHYYFQINGAKDFLMELFKKSNRLLVLLFDEVEMFVRSNRETHPSTIDVFTYAFLRDLTDPGIDARPIYVAFTSEKEMYEYIRLNCQNFQRVADTHEIMMKEFNDVELRILADNILNKIIRPLFGNRLKIKQLPEEEFVDLIKEIRTSVNNKTTPGNFTKYYINRYLDYYDINFDLISNISDEYEKIAFNEFEKVIKRNDPEFKCGRKAVIHGQEFDGYGELLNNGTPVRRAYAEFTMSEANPEKANRFIGRINNLREAGAFDDSSDTAIFISPSVTDNARDMLKKAGIVHHPLENYSIDLIEFQNTIYMDDINEDTDDFDVIDNNGDRTEHIKQILLRDYKNWKMFRILENEFKKNHPEITKKEIVNAIYELKEDNLIRTSSKKITPTTKIYFSATKDENIL
ncbi:hypothetical protein CUJ83_00820 [Methanocella sp. CWC-04]|uniref:Uncharacterized protein n=1 Tax=Methanooceanicella nereidis TaxID=2052831 RepID=A0AAP2R9S7_9EURY|nr:hypothetical protein [Methanocella sp. CWC-04]MCD1293538.1 hypothetical protein [Methanocella sp. CWC-04]